MGLWIEFMWESLQRNIALYHGLIREQEERCSARRPLHGGRLSLAFDRLCELDEERLVEGG